MIFAASCFPLFPVLRTGTKFFSSMPYRTVPAYFHHWLHKGNLTLYLKPKVPPLRQHLLLMFNIAQTSFLTSNVLPTATLDLSYFNQKLTTLAFFDTGPQQSFVIPKVVHRLNLPVLERVPIQLATFRNDSTSCILDLVKVKVQFGNHRFTVKLLVHDQASMELNCSGIHEVSQQLEQQGYQLADHYITSDALTGIKVLILVDYFYCILCCQRRARGMNLFVTRDRGVIPLGPMPK